MIRVDPGIYRHVENDELYAVLMMVRRHGTGELEVVYVPLYKTDTTLSLGVQATVTPVERFIQRFKRVDAGGSQL